jgi:hypothetical protein
VLNGCRPASPTHGGLLVPDIIWWTRVEASLKYQRHPDPKHSRERRVHAACPRCEFCGQYHVLGQAPVGDTQAHAPDDHRIRDALTLSLAVGPVAAPEMLHHKLEDPRWHHAEVQDKAGVPGLFLEQLLDGQRHDVGGLASEHVTVHHLVCAQDVMGQGTIGREELQVKSGCSMRYM